MKKNVVFTPKLYESYHKLVEVRLLEFFRIIERGGELVIQGLDVPIKLFTI